MKRLIVSAGFIFMTLSIPQNGIARKHTISLTQETVAYTPIVPLEKANKNQHRSAKKHKQQLKKGNAMSAKNGSIIIGIALLLMGLLVLWYLSIILGIFISLGGLVLLIIGIGIKGDKNPDEKIKKENKKDVPPAPAKKRDIVHLKNGSIIKGEILEQIMGESVKIETGDGSIFIYKSAEIEKITKE